MTRRHLTLALVGSTVLAPRARAQPTSVHPGLIEHFDRALTRLATDGLFSGTVVISRNGVPVLEHDDHTRATPGEMLRRSA